MPSSQRQSPPAAGADRAVAARPPGSPIRQPARTAGAKANPTAVRRAAETDVPSLTRLLGRAFYDDPLAVWACRSANLRPRMLESIHRARLCQLLAHEEIWTTPEISSAALWAPPGRLHTPLLQNARLARGFLDSRLLMRLPLLALGLTRIQRRRSHSPPHWYLALLGTDPDVQGHGLGSAVLAPVLERCDGDCVGAYLESSHERNLDFYARHGFRVTGELRLPRGPRVWTMWREPRVR
jgi:ribosomal protein S18 acetylase RimI-like enzyme